MIFKLASGRSASSARTSLKLNTEAFEKTAAAGTDARIKKSQNAKLLDKELIPSIRAQQLQPKRGELVAVLWPGSAFTEGSWLTHMGCRSAKGSIYEPWANQTAPLRADFFPQLLPHVPMLV